LKILQVNTLYPPDAVGGAERTVAAISAELSTNGDAVRVAALKSTRGQTVEKQSCATVHRVGLKNIFWPFNHESKSAPKKAVWHFLDRWNPFMAKEFGKVLDQTNPDVVVTHNLQGWSASIWKEVKSRNITLVHTLHDHSLLCPRTTMHKEGKNCTKVCSDCSFYSKPRMEATKYLDGVMSVSKDLLDRHIKFHALNPTLPKRVIYNSVPRTFPVLQDVRPLRSPELHLRIGFIGRVEAVKGIETLLSACTLLNQSENSENFSLRIAGQGLPDYIAKLKSRWPRSSAEFLGPCDAVSFMDSIDVLVVPSLLSEGLGNVALEAMARGVAVIASNCGGLKEVLDHGAAGWLIEPGDDKELAYRLSALITDRRILGKLAFAALTRSAFFSVDRQMSEIHDFLSVADKSKASCN
jgi:glycosyltransferase involved in cell wall biosynthesis